MRYELTEVERIAVRPCLPHQPEACRRSTIDVTPFSGYGAAGRELRRSHATWGRHATTPSVRARTAGEARQVATASYPGAPGYGATRLGGL